MDDSVPLLKEVFKRFSEKVNDHEYTIMGGVIAEVVQLDDTRYLV